MTDQERLAAYEAAIDDLWANISSIEGLEPETIEVCKELHERLYHADHTIEMYDGAACCACGWTGLPDEIAAHKAEVNA